MYKTAFSSCKCMLDDELKKLCVVGVACNNALISYTAGRPFSSGKHLSYPLTTTQNIPKSTWIKQ